MRGSAPEKSATVAEYNCPSICVRKIKQIFNCPSKMSKSNAKFTIIFILHELLAISAIKEDF